jgi:hypothetical protein
MVLLGFGLQFPSDLKVTKPGAFSRTPKFSTTSLLSSVLTRAQVLRIFRAPVTHSLAEGHRKRTFPTCLWMVLEPQGCRIAKPLSETLSCPGSSKPSIVLSDMGKFRAFTYFCLSLSLVHSAGHCQTIQIHWLRRLLGQS